MNCVKVPSNSDSDFIRFVAGPSSMVQLIPQLFNTHARPHGLLQLLPLENFCNTFRLWDSKNVLGICTGVNYYYIIILCTVQESKLIIMHRCGYV